MKKEFNDYFFGIDAGTDSVGWAVTDTEYNLQKINGKAMWGIRLFDEGQPAKKRRLFRTSRRRQGRRVQRTKLLQELFSEEISKTDPSFYQRMEESKLLSEDKTLSQKNTLFNDKVFDDKVYHKNYPTIYHLRKAFIDGEKITDTRLLYLAVHHIISNRGHFLFEGMDFGNAMKFEVVYNTLNSCLNDEFDFSFPINNIKEIENSFKMKANISTKKKVLEKVLECDTKQKKAMAYLLAGASGIKLADIFDDEGLNDEELNKVTFSTSSYDENYDALSDILQDKMTILDCLKSVYDFAVLSDILNNEQYISYAKVKTYEKHKSDLLLLKRVIRKYAPDKYDSVFKDADNPSNYCAYVGMCKKNGRKIVVENKKCLKEDFCKFTKSILKNADTQDPDITYIFDEIDKNTFMPKQTSKENSVIPYQVNLVELKKILENAQDNFAFLSVKDENGLTVTDKLIKLFTFKIPYYVGPLNDLHKDSGNCWVVKKSNERITPWNFDDIVDKQASSEKFILRMTNKCTYLIGEDVLPKNSLLYSEFSLLNELNNLRIDGELLSVEDKNKIFDEVFKNKNTVKLKDIVNYYKRSGVQITAESISGIDGDFKSNLKSYRDFYRILGDNFNEEYAEEAIKSIVILGDAKKMLLERLKMIGNGYFSNEQIKQIVNLKYSGWGRLSKKFLTEIYNTDKSTGECQSIITMLHSTSENLMQLLGNKYEFISAVNEYNSQFNEDTNDFSYDNLVKDLYASPSVKRGIWQILTIMREVEKIMGKPPKKIFIEMAREEGEKKRTESRQKKLIELYKNCKDDARDWCKEISEHTDGELRQAKLYLYYTQMGRCMYSGEKINLDDLFSENIYDIDHIYPQSKTKDDSIDNRILVKKVLNNKKGDRYPVPEDVKTAEAENLWKMLKAKGLISKEKYDRLVRKNGFTDDELSGFIARQLVETRQSTKAAAELLSKIYPDTRIVYSKASNVDVFKKYFKIIKVREVNDYHHAKDAYINIVVGNVFDVKFTLSPYNFVKKKIKYSLNECMYESDISRNGYFAWKAGENGTIGKVKSVLSKDNILSTRYAFETKGGLFDQQLLKRKKELFPIKLSDPRLTVEKYGGYNKVKGAYYILVEHCLKGKTVRTIEYVPVYLSKSIEEDSSVLDDYVSNTLELVDAKILLRKIKTNTLFKYNGFLMRITGRTGTQLVFQSAVQLKLDKNAYNYAKKIVKYIGKCKAAKKELIISKYDEITIDNNLMLYDELLFKLESTIYNTVYKIRVDTLKNGKKTFVDLSIEMQAKVLFEILKLFQCKTVEADLTDIGGVKTPVRICISKNVTKQKNLYIINQSPTGIFENIIDLKAL